MIRFCNISVTAILGSVSLAMLASAANAAGQSKTIDYGMLFVGKDAPPHAKTKLKHAAQLAVRDNRCASVGSGFYIPPKEQKSSHRGEPYMVTCKASDAEAYYNVYFSDTDLKASRTKTRATPVSKDKALEVCASALRNKYPTAKLDGFRTAYDASKSTSNVRQEIGLSVENQFGVKVDRVGNCIITPNGHLSKKDVWLTKK